MRDEATNYPAIGSRKPGRRIPFELKTRDRERRLIKKIDSTLEMISIDDYGYCESCGIEIGIRRLEARPTATQCIDCRRSTRSRSARRSGRPPGHTPNAKWLHTQVASPGPQAHCTLAHWSPASPVFSMPGRRAGAGCCESRISTPREQPGADDLIMRTSMPTVSSGRRPLWQHSRLE